MKALFQTADGLICMDELPNKEHLHVIKRVVQTHRLASTFEEASTNFEAIPTRSYAYIGQFGDMPVYQEE